MISDYPLVTNFRKTKGGSQTGLHVGLLASNFDFPTNKSFLKLGEREVIFLYWGEFKPLYSPQNENSLRLKTWIWRSKFWPNLKLLLF